MAYKYTTGSSDTGDLYRDGDTGRNTYINFEEDSIGLVAGGVDLLKVTEATQDIVVINEAAADIDFRVESSGEDEAIFLDAGNNTLYINKGETAFVTVIGSTNDEAIRVGAAGVVLNEDGHATNDFRVESDTNTHMIFVDAGSNEVGIGTSSPNSVFEVSGSQAGNYFGIANNTHSPYALDETHHIVHYYGSGNATIQLPAVAGCTGRIYHIITNCGGASDEVTVDPNGGEMISGSNVQNGATTQLGIDGQDPQSITIVSTGAHWHVLSDARAQGGGE